jgi:hypothetical protein
LAAGGGDGQGHVVDVRDPEAPDLLASTADADEEAQDLAWSPDGQVLVVAGSRSAVHLYAVDQGLDLVASLDGEDTGDGPGARTAAFTSGGDRLVTASSPDARAGRAATVSVWDLGDLTAPGLVAGPVEGPGGTVVDLAVSPADDRVAAVALDGSTWVWSLQDLEDQGVIDPEADDNSGVEPWAVLGSEGASMQAVMFGPENDALWAAGDGGLDEVLFITPPPASGLFCLLDQLHGLIVKGDGKVFQIIRSRCRINDFIQITLLL